MSRKTLFILPLIFLAIILAACNLHRQAVSLPPTVTTPPVPINTALPPTPPPSPTPLLPTPTPTTTSAPPTPTSTLVPTSTPSLPSGPTLKRFAAGQQVAITSIHMISETTGWAIGGLPGVGDHVLRTIDGGKTWSDVTPPELAPTGDLRLSAEGFFQSTETAWVTYDNQDRLVPATPVVWWTLDGGKSWAASQPLDVTNLAEVYLISDLQFVDSQNGWLLAHVGAGMNHDYVVLFHSADGGQTWQRLLDPFTDGGIQSCYKNTLLFADPLNGWLTGDCNAVMAGVFLFHTGDGGTTWDPVTLPEPAGKTGIFSDFNVGCNSDYPVFFSPQVGKLAVKCTYFTEDPIRYEYYLYSTSDGGITWSLGKYPGGAVIFFDPDSGLALGRDIYQTQDGGVTWTKFATVNWDAQFSFISVDVGWAVARSGDQIALVTTTNGGKRWAELQPLVGP